MDGHDVAEMQQPKPKKLTPKEQKFVASYCVHFNGARAAREAGFETVEPQAYAYEVLRKPHIQARCSEVLNQLGEAHFKLHEENTARLMQMRDADRTAIYDADGNVKDPREWPEACKALLVGIEVEEEMRGEGDARFLVRTKKVRLEPPKAIIDSLAKITGQWIERSQMIGKDGKPVDPQSVVPVLIVSYGDKLPEKIIP